MTPVGIFLTFNSTKYYRRFLLGTHKAAHLKNYRNTQSISTVRTSFWIITFLLRNHLHQMVDWTNSSSLACEMAVSWLGFLLVFSIYLFYFVGLQNWGVCECLIEIYYFFPILKKWKRKTTLSLFIWHNWKTNIILPVALLLFVFLLGFWLHKQQLWCLIWKLKNAQPQIVSSVQIDQFLYPFLYFISSTLMNMITLKLPTIKLIVLLGPIIHFISITLAMLWRTSEIL